MSQRHIRLRYAHADGDIPETQIVDDEEIRRNLIVALFTPDDIFQACEHLLKNPDQSLGGPAAMYLAYTWPGTHITQVNLLGYLILKSETFTLAECLEQQNKPLHGFWMEDAMLAHALQLVNGLADITYWQQRLRRPEWPDALSEFDKAQAAFRPMLGIATGATNVPPLQLQLGRMIYTDDNEQLPFPF